MSAKCILAVDPRLDRRAGVPLPGARRHQRLRHACARRKKDHGRAEAGPLARHGAEHILNGGGGL